MWGERRFEWVKSGRSMIHSVGKLGIGKRVLDTGRQMDGQDGMHWARRSILVLDGIGGLFRDRTGHGVRLGRNCVCTGDMRRWL